FSSSIKLWVPNCAGRHYLGTPRAYLGTTSWITIAAVTKYLRQSWMGYLASVLTIAGATALLKLLGPQINPTTVALAFLLIVLFVATVWGSRPAIVCSLFGVACFNFFFLPPFGTFTISAPDNWIALFAFLVTAVTAGQLSARVKRRAEEAEAAR